jgi:hypothetical protein
MSADHKHNTGRTVAVVGGGALLLLLLLRGKGWGLGGRGDGADEQRTTDEPIAASRPPARCAVRVDSAGIQLDGAHSDLDTTVARCRAAGTADVLVTGAAIQGVVDRLLAALRAASVSVHLSNPSAARTTEAR